MVVKADGVMEWKVNFSVSKGVEQIARKVLIDRSVSGSTASLADLKRKRNDGVDSENKDAPVDKKKLARERNVDK